MISIKQFEFSEYPAIDIESIKKIKLLDERMAQISYQLLQKSEAKKVFDHTDYQKASHLLRFSDYFEDLSLSILINHAKKMQEDELNCFIQKCIGLQKLVSYAIQNVMLNGDAFDSHKVVQTKLEKCIKHLKNIIKIIEELPNINKTNMLELSAESICFSLCQLGQSYFGDGNYSIILSLADQLSYWMTRTSTQILVKKSVDMKGVEHHILESRDLKQWYMQNMNFMLCNYYRGIGQIYKASMYMDKVLNNNAPRFDEKVVMIAAQLIFHYGDSRYCHTSYKLLCDCLSYIDRHLAKKNLSPSLIKYCMQMQTTLSQLIPLAIEDVSKSQLDQLTLELKDSIANLLPDILFSIEVVGKDLRVCWNKPITLNRRQLRFAAKYVEYQLTENSMLICDIHQIKYKQLRGIVNFILQRLSANESDLAKQLSLLTLAPEEAKIEPVTLAPQNPSLPVTEDSPKKQKVKTRNKVAKTEEKSATCPQTELTRHLTAREVGFTTVVDQQVYMLSGGFVSPGIHYAYGLQISNDNDKITADDRKSYQRMLEDGHVVAPKQNGVRVVGTKESGLKQITFKLADRSKDVRILFELKEQVTDANGQTKFLYRAGRAVYH